MHKLRRETLSGFFNDVVETKENGFMVCGGIIDSAAATPDIWMVHLDSMGCLSDSCSFIIDIPDALNDLPVPVGFQIFPNPNPNPNPTSDYLNIQVSQNLILGELHFQITNLQGQLIQSFIPDEYEIALDVSNWPPGIYFLQCQDENQQYKALSFVVTK